MAGDWVKWVKGLSKRREVIVLARKLGMSRREAACACMEMWEWADDETANGHILGATGEDIDLQLGLPGFALALQSPEVGWLRVNSQGITFPRWDRHNGESAKRRANDAAKKRQQRDLGSGRKSRKKRDKRPEDVPKKPGPEERRREESERREENILSREDRSADRRGHDFETPANGDGAHSPPSGRSPPLGRSRRKFLDREGEEPFDLSEVDWSVVVGIAESAAKHIPPMTDDDRRAWIRYAVMASVIYGDGWMTGTAFDIAHASDTKETRQARFVGALQGKAREADGTDSEAFNGIARRIEIPDDVWKSDAVPIGGKWGRR